ncbi:efflux transporter periplasmic adaptor subunit [Massilia eurypsychrophila]|uniref:Efflux transporter periplasmic adaptor subunit n=1 Tax=Massilia eurypsychrophila TaxID=1485217 RepID=A0A2G8TEU7_9BURK|nr:efflux transporter periplasmic adaptor subunit [Massilia eurypsychrophila]
MPIRDALSKVKQHWLAAALAVAALLGAAYAARALLFGAELKVYPVERRELLQTVVASGRVETPLRIEIGSQVTGAVAAIPVAEGQAVKAGQVLIELDHGEAAAAVEQARAAVGQASARLQQVRDVGLPVAQQARRQADANLFTVRRQFARSKELFARGFVGQAALDEAERNLQVADSEAASARLQARSMGDQGSDLLMAQAALAQSRAALRLVEARLGYTTITAPADGVLIARAAERGDVVQPGKVLMVLSPAGRTQLVVQIDEKNIALLHLGQAALASADAYPARRFGAVLAYVNPAVDPQRGSLEVKFDVPRPPPYLRQDMTVSVDVEVARRPNAVVLPTETLHDTAGSSPWVLKVAGGRLRRQPVKLGASGGGNTEIVAGLQPGDLVAPAAGAALAEGTRVRPVTAVAAANGGNGGDGGNGSNGANGMRGAPAAAGRAGNSAAPAAGG